MKRTPQSPAAGLVRQASEPPLVLGHRGYSSRAPENTLAAFRMIRELGIAGAELDVHQCATGELVVCHDPSLKRTGGVDLLITESPLAELREHSVGRWKGDEFAGERIPLLEEVLEELGPDVFLDVEVKHHATRVSWRPNPTGVEAEMVRLLRRHGFVGRCMVSSFDPFIVARVRRCTRDIPVAVIYADSDGMPLLLRRGGGRLIAGARIMKPHHDLADDRTVRRHHRGGRPVFAWTVDDPDLARRLADSGVDGLITNEPELICAALR